MGEDQRAATEINDSVRSQRRTTASGTGPRPRPLSLIQAMGSARTLRRPDSMIIRRSRSFDNRRTSFSSASLAMTQSMVEWMVTPLDRRWR